TITPDDVHQAQRQRGIRAGADGQPPVAACRCLAAIRIDADDLRPRFAGAVHDRPKVHVRNAGVRSPVDDVARMDYGFWIERGSRAERHVAASGAGSRTDGAVEQGGAEAVEEPPIQTAALQLAHRSSIAVRLNRLPSFGRGSARG